MGLCKQFSDDEEEADEPLAPLPDEPEVVEGDEDMDQDEPTASVAPDATTETNFVHQEAPEESQTKPSSPPPPALSLQHTESMLSVEEAADMLDASFKALDGGITVDVNVHENAHQADVGGLDMSVLGPDGTSYESVHDLSQLDGNALLGGPLMGDAGDPFVQSMEHQPSDQGTPGQPLP